MDDEELIRPEDWTRFDEAVDAAMDVDGDIFDRGALSRRLETMSGVRDGFDDEVVRALINRSRGEARALSQDVKPVSAPEIKVVKGRGMGLEEMIQFQADVGQHFKARGDIKPKKGDDAVREGGVAGERPTGGAGGERPTGGSAGERKAGGASGERKTGGSEAPEQKGERLSLLLPGIPKRPLAYADLQSRVSILQDPKFPSVAQIRSMLDEVGKADPFARAAMADLPWIVAPWSKVEAKRIIADELRLDLTYNGVDYADPVALKDGKLDPARRLAAEAIVNYAIGAARQGRYAQSGFDYGGAFGVDLFGSSIRQQGSGAGALMQRARYRVGEVVTPYTLDLPKKAADYLFPKDPNDSSFFSMGTLNDWTRFGLSAFLPEHTRDKVSDIQLPFASGSSAQYLTATRLRSMFRDPATGEQIPEQGVFMDADGRFRLVSVQARAGSLSIPGYTRGTMFGAPGTADAPNWERMRDMDLVRNTLDPRFSSSATLSSPKLIGGRVADAYDPGAWIHLGGDNFEVSGVYSDLLKKGRKLGRNFLEGDSAVFTADQIRSQELTFRTKFKSAVQLDHVVSLSWAYEHGAAKILRSAFESGKYEMDPRWERWMTVLQLVGAGGGAQWQWTSSELNRIKSDKGPANFLNDPEAAPFFSGRNDRRMAYVQHFLAARQQIIRKAQDLGWTDPDFLAIPREDQLAIEMARRGWYDSNRFIRPFQELYLDRIQNPNLMEETLHRQINGTIAATMFTVGWNVATWKYTPKNQVYLLYRSVIAPALGALWDAPFKQKGSAFVSALRDSFGGGHPLSLQKRFAFQEYLGENGDISKFQWLSREMASSGLRSDIVHAGQTVKSFAPRIGTATWGSGFGLGFGTRDAFGAPKDVVAPSHLLTRVDHESFQADITSRSGHTITGNMNPLDWSQRQAHIRYLDFLSTGDESLLLNPKNPALEPFLGSLRARDATQRKYQPFIATPLDPGSPAWNERLNWLQQLERTEGLVVTPSYIDARPFTFYNVEQSRIFPGYGMSRNPRSMRYGYGEWSDPAKLRSHWLGQYDLADRFLARGADEHAVARELLHHGLMKDAMASERAKIRLLTSSVDGRVEIQSGVAIAEAFGALSGGGWKTADGWNRFARSLFVDGTIRLGDYGVLRGGSNLASNFSNIAPIWGIEAGFGFLASKSGMTSHATLDLRSYDYGKGGFYGGWTRVRSELASRVQDAQEAMRAAESMPVTDRMERRLQRLERASQLRFELSNARLFGEGMPSMTPSDAMLERRLLDRVGWKPSPEAGITNWRDLFTASGDFLSPNESFIPDQRGVDGLRAILEREKREARAIEQFKAQRRRDLLSSDAFHELRDRYISDRSQFASHADVLAEIQRLNEERDAAITMAKVNLDALTGYQRVVEDNLAATPGAMRLLSMKPGLRRTVANIAATHPGVPVLAGRAAHFLTKGVYESARAPFRLLSRADGYIKRTPGLSRTISAASFASIGLGYVESVARTRAAMGLLEQDWYSLPTSERAALDEASRWSFAGAALDIGFSNSPYEAAAATGLALLNIGSAEYIRSRLPQAAKDDRDSRILARTPRLADEQRMLENEQMLLRQGLLMPMRNALMDPHAFYRQDSAYKSRYFGLALERAKNAGSAVASEAVKKAMARMDSAQAQDLRNISRGARDVVSRVALGDFDSRHAVRPAYKNERLLHLMASPFQALLPTKMEEASERMVDRVDSLMIRTIGRIQNRSDLSRSAQESRLRQAQVRRVYVDTASAPQSFRTRLEAMLGGFNAAQTFGSGRSTDSLDLARDVAQRTRLNGQRQRELDSVRLETVSRWRDPLAPYRGGN